MTLSRKVFSEFLGSMGLLIVVVGSGIMGESLSQGNAAIALLTNSLATGAGLYALIQTFGPVSGAHFNPVVSFVEWRWKKISTPELIYFIIAQILGATTGVFLTHIMFNQKLLQLSQHNRGDFRFFLSEIIATCGLILVIALSGKRNIEATPAAVARLLLSIVITNIRIGIANVYFKTTKLFVKARLITLKRKFVQNFNLFQFV